MTVTTEAARKSIFDGTGSTGPFTFNWRVLAAADIIVTHVDSSGTTSTYTTPGDYTISLVDAGQSGGSITLTTALASGEQLIIDGDAPYTQEVKLRNQGRYDAEVHESVADKLTILVQEMRDTLSRCIKIPSADDTGTTTEVTTEENRANKALVFDTDGNAIASTYDANDSGIAAAVAQAEAAQTAAETAQTNAETAETNAETAETNAATSAAAAAASAGSIDLAGMQLFLSSNYV